MKIKWTQKAQSDLVGIARYIQADNVDAAKRLLINLRKRVLLLQDNVFLGRVVPEVSNKMIREVIYKNYRIIYRIKSDTIEIITVFEGHKLLDERNY